MSALAVLSIRLSSFLSSSIVTFVSKLIRLRPNRLFLMASLNAFLRLRSTTLTLPGKAEFEKKLEDGLQVAAKERPFRFGGFYGPQPFIQFLFRPSLNHLRNRCVVADLVCEVFRDIRQSRRWTEAEPGDE